jgi:anti-sigma regulatory factor (Ser/Thr protein kinase)
VQGFSTHTGHYRFPAESQSVSRARHAVTGFAREHGVPVELLGNIALAVSEACTNVVVHAYREAAAAGNLSVGLELEEGSLHIQIGDEGMGMRRRPDSPGLGLGLPIIASVADGFAVEPGPDGGTDLCMRFDLAPPLAAGSAPLVA